MLSSLDESYFHYEPARAAYRRIITISKKRGKLIGYEDLLEDPSLDQEFRDILREAKYKPAKSPDLSKDLLERLTEYRKARSLYYLAKHISDEMRGEKVDVDSLLDYASDSITTARTAGSSMDHIHSIGAGATNYDLADIATSEESDKLLLTGFKEYDEKNGGLPSSGVMLLAATTSGGKSTLRMNLVKNLYLLNSVSCLTVSLEMNERKETRRLLSCISNVPYWKFVKKRLLKEDKRAYKKAWKEFHEHGEANGCNYAILCPRRSMSITSLLMLVKPYGYKVIAIDYISLLEGLSDENQWRVLSDITRECKIFSEENDCLVILLAQLDSADDRIRYSAGILENVDNAWTWNYSKPEQRELHVLPIQQRKARDQELFPFDLRENFPFMQVLNMDDDKAVDTTSAPSDVDDPLAESATPYEDVVA